MIPLHGVVASGLGQGAQFMGVPWVRDGIRRLIGFDPYPGTLNVKLVDADMVVTWRRILDGSGLWLAPPPRERCGARLYRMILDPDIDAAVIVPDVTRHGENLLELIAPIHVRSRLELRDDDRVTLRVPPGVP